MYVMADRERLLRAGVLLLVGIAESKEEWSGVRVAPDRALEEQLVAGGRGIAGERWALFEGALDAAVAAELRPHSVPRRHQCRPLAGGARRRPGPRLGTPARRPARFRIRGRGPRRRGPFGAAARIQGGPGRPPGTQWEAGHLGRVLRRRSRRAVQDGVRDRGRPSRRLRLRDLRALPSAGRRRRGHRRRRRPAR
jgi:hypothetical protein